MIDQNTVAIVTAIVGGIVSIASAYFAYKSKQTAKQTEVTATQALLNSENALKTNNELLTEFKKLND